MENDQVDGLNPFVLLPAALARAGAEHAPSVRVLREWAADLRFPATRLPNGKWGWRDADLPQIAAAVNGRVMARA
jgi:hypothetical protein